MNQITRQATAAFTLCAFWIQSIAPVFAAESRMDVYPAPPTPPKDAFAPQWKAPEPTLTGKSVQPAALKLAPSAPFKGFSPTATMEEVENAGTTVVGLVSTGDDNAKPFPDQKLKSFLQDHHLKGGVIDRGAVPRLKGFLAENQESPDRFTILMELADAQWRHGWFMDSLDSYRSAWDLGKQFKDPHDAALGQKALCELLTAYSALGSIEALNALLQEASGIELSGAARECYRKAETLKWHLENKAEQNIFCGFTALNSICVPRGMGAAFPDVHDEEERKLFIEKGLSVFELIAHSHESGGKSLAVRVVGNAAIPVPSVVHWKFNHYSAITKQEGTRYYIEDSHLKYSGWIEKEVLESTGSGVFVLPEATVNREGCVDLTDAEMKSFFGRHCVHGRDDEGDTCKTGCSIPAMATHGFSLLNPGLAIGDIPIKLDAPYGPSLRFQIEYLQRRNGTLSSIPLTVGSNMGSTFSHNYMEWIELKGNGTPNSQVNLVTGDGSYYYHDLPTLSGGVHVYNSRYEDRPKLEWNGSAFFLRYEDGSYRRYGRAAGSTRYLLDQIVDSFGSMNTLSYEASTHRLLQVTDATGRFLQFSYTPVAGDGLASNTTRIRKVTDSHGRSASFRYDSTGRLIKSIDTLNITSEFTYGASDFIEKLTTPYGATRFEFEDLPGLNSEPGRRIKATDPYGFVECAEQNDLAPAPEFDQDMKDLQGGNILASVNIPVAGQNVSFMPKNENLQWRNTWYWDKNAWYHAPGDYSQATVYNWLAVNDFIVGVLASMKHAHEGRIWFNYKNQPSAHAPGTHSSPSKILRRVETPTGLQWAMRQAAYDGPLGKPSRGIDPVGRESTFSYAGNNLTTMSVRTGPGVNDFTALGAASNYLNGQPQTVSDVSGVTQAITYNSVGQVTQIVTQNGSNSETTKFTYDSVDGTKTKGFLLNIQHTSPASPSTFVTLRSLTYDTFKRVRTATDEQGYVCTYDYDAMDRVRLVTHPDATKEQYEYEILDLTASKNRKGEWNRTKYTALRQPAYTIDPQGRVTSYEYCLCGKIKKLTDARGNVTRWVRDNMGRLLERISPDLTKTTLAYQARSGLLGSVTRPNDQGSGHVTSTYSYTLDGKLASVDYYDPLTPDLAANYNDVNGVADPLGRLISITDPTGTTQFSYKPLLAGNGAGKLYEENGPLADDTIRRDYDWKGSYKSHQVRNDAGVILHSESVVTDSLGRTTQILNELGTFTAGYDAGNISQNLNSLNRPNGTNTRTDWFAANAGSDALGLKEIHHTQGAVTVSKFSYNYGSAGQILKWNRQLDALAANRKDWTLDYNRSGELSGLIEKDASAVEIGRSTWSHDPAGNWYASGDQSTTTHRTHDTMNRLTRIGGSGRTVVEGTLDEPANVTVGGQPAEVSSLPGTTEFKFQKEIPVQEGNNNFQIIATDVRGNPRTQNYSMQVGPSQKTYEYDLNGNLLREKDAAGSIIRSFEWDAADRIKAVNWGTQRIEWTYNGSGQRVSETVNGVLAKRYLWDGVSLLLEKTPSHVITKRLYGGGEQRVGTPDAGNYFYTRDHLGSVREVVNQSGVIQARYDYDAYGKQTTLFKAPAYLDGCVFGYTGHIKLPSLGVGQSELVLTHYRIYDPVLGRWLSADPIAEAGGLNLYGYVSNNPAGAIDPDGRDAVAIGGGWYNFVVNWKNFGVDSADAFIKKYPNHYVRHYGEGMFPDETDNSMDCATTAQFLSGTKKGTKKGRKMFDAPLAETWRQGPEVTKKANITPGTLIAAGWLDGKYQNVGIAGGAGNHTAIFLGYDGNRLMVLHGWDFQPMFIGEDDSHKFFVVKSKSADDGAASKCKIKK